MLGLHWPTCIVAPTTGSEFAHRSSKLHINLFKMRLYQELLDMLHLFTWLSMLIVAFSPYNLLTKLVVQTADLPELYVCLVFFDRNDKEEAHKKRRFDSFIGGFTLLGS